MKNWTIPTSFDAWARQIEKRLLATERRPSLHSISDMLGPGFAPKAVEIDTWDGPTALFNGIFYSGLQVPSAPDMDQGFIGQTMATDRYGVQIAYAVHDDSGNGVVLAPYQRTFFAPGGNTPPLFTAWNVF